MAALAEGTAYAPAVRAATHASAEILRVFVMHVTLAYFPRKLDIASCVKCAFYLEKSRG